MLPSATSAMLSQRPKACGRGLCFSNMNVVALTQQLVDIESTTGDEGRVGHFLLQELRRLGYNVQRMVAEGERANVYATAPQQPNPAMVFSTHMDTVPPYIPSSEDEQRIYGRGSCDAKGIIAGQIAAALVEAHAKRIFHRDLKPGNIMIATSGVKGSGFWAGEIGPG